MNYNSTVTANTGASASARNELDFDAFRLLRWNQWFYEGFGSFLQSSESRLMRKLPPEEVWGAF